MGLFYAYLKDIRTDEFNRYLITFASRETADEWWRMISTFPSPYASSVERITPQFYVQNKEHSNVIDFFSTTALQPHAKQFLKRMFFTLVNDRDGKVLVTSQPTALSINVTDHISGGWYFIRSKNSDPRRHWYFRTDGPCLVCGDVNCDAIHVSTEHRTKFCIQVRNLANNGQQVANDLVMIGKDEISIAASKDYTLHVNNMGELKATKTQSVNSELLFGDLKNRFRTRAEKIWEAVIPVERGLGEAWELVN